MTRAPQLAVGLVAMFLVACDDEPIAGPAPSSSEVVSAQAPAPPVSADVAANMPDGGLPEIDFQELDYGESERSRDPFRSYAETFIDEAAGKVKSQREVILSEFSLNDLKLSAIVMGANPSRAMLVEPSGKGYVVRRGQFIGRPETVAGDGQSGASYEVNWRIDQIRPSDVVFVREDPNNPDVPTATKVMSLHPEGEADALE